MMRGIGKGERKRVHGALGEELYMRVTERIDGSKYAGKVLKLDRALYGLKQAGRVLNHRSTLDSTSASHSSR